MKELYNHETRKKQIKTVTDIEAPDIGTSVFSEETARPFLKQKDNSFTVILLLLITAVLGLIYWYNKKQKENE